MNQAIMGYACTAEKVLSISENEFKASLMSNCFVLWKLPTFEKHKLTQTPVMPNYANYCEQKNGKLHGELLRAHLDAGLHPVVYQGENGGHLIRHVCPMMATENTISSQGGKYDFFPHVDNPDLVITGEPVNPLKGNSPDTLTLLCLRKEEGVSTSLLKLDDVLSQLSPAHVESLAKPQFAVNRPASFDKSREVLGLPVLVNASGVWHSRFDWHNVRGMNPDAEIALEALRYVTLEKEHWFNVPLEPGYAVTFLNQRTLHTRNAWQPRYDGTDRWLLRVFGMMTKPLDSQLLDAAACEHNLRTL